jgi:4-hydroxybenzoate polyprenyltransferase
VDKYLIIVLMFLIAGMGIAITRSPPSLGLFYSMLAGAIIVIIYSSIKSRKQNSSKSKKMKK